MAKYRISETVPCFVTWVYEIEANDEDDAQQKFINGEHGTEASEPIIGDSIDYAEQELRVELLHPAGDFVKKWIKPKDRKE